MIIALFIFVVYLHLMRNYFNAFPKTMENNPTF